MARTHKAQHWVPKSYLQAWVDPSTPAGHQPYVHVFTKDGSGSRKRAPQNVFTETDLYTIALPDGGRDLRLERGLKGLEDAFAIIRRDFLNDRRHLPLPRYGKLVAFVSAMHARTPARRDHWMGFWQEILDIGEQIERQMKSATPEARERAARLALPSDRPNMSLDQVRHITSSPMEHTLGPHIKAEFPLMMLMRCVVLCSDGRTHFITSDSPVVWFDPEWHRKPPMYQSPSFSDPALEISMPISPTQILLFVHRKLEATKNVEYIDVDAGYVHELNRRTRFGCHENFVGRTSQTDARWFDQGERP